MDFNFETVIYGYSTQHKDRILLVEFKSVEPPDFVLKNKWYVVYVDGVAEFCIPQSVWCDSDTQPLEW